MHIEVSESTFSRLQANATPLVDTVDAVIVRLLDAYEKKETKVITTHQIEASSKSAAEVPGNVQKMIARMQLKGFLKELWELVIVKMPLDRFTLRDVYERKGPLVELRPHVKEIDASIRAGLEKLRDRELLEFVDNRGTYRRLS